MRRLLAMAFGAFAFASAAMAGPGQTPEPAGLWLGAIAGYTPSTLRGAEVIEPAAAAKLAEQGALLIDVSEEDRKPANLPATAIWRPQHRSIPGSVWFPGASWGDLAPEREAALKARVMALSGGDLTKPVVAFCHPDCWGSWNMGKRLIAWGFKRVYWFPRGISGWQEADHPTAVIKPDAEWAAAAAPVR